MEKAQSARDKAMETCKLYMASGWEIAEETETYFLMKKNTATFTGHILLLVFTGIFTVGLGNLIYHLASRKRKKVII